VVGRELPSRISRRSEGGPPDEGAKPARETRRGLLQRCGVPLYLASGTDLAYVQNEVRALGLDTKSTVLGAIENRQQMQLGSRAGFELGQGRAIRMPYPPPVIPART
jgi:hypothetical protein